MITNVTLTHDALYFTTKYGEAFVGYISRKAPPTQPQPIRREKEKDNKKSALVKFLEKDDCTSVKIARIPNVHRAVAIAVDNEGLNFACLQVYISLSFQDIDTNVFKNNWNIIIVKLPQTTLKLLINSYEFFHSSSL